MLPHSWNTLKKKVSLAKQRVSPHVQSHAEIVMEVCLCVHMCMCLCVHVCVSVYALVCVCVCVFTYVCLSVWVRVYMF